MAKLCGWVEMATRAPEARVAHLKILARGQHALRGGEFKAISKGRRQRHAGGNGAIQQGEGHAHELVVLVSILQAEFSPHRTMQIASEANIQAVAENPASTSPAQG